VGSSLRAVAAKPMPTVSTSHQAALTGLTEEVRASNASVLQEVQRMLSTSREDTSLKVHHNDVYEEEMLEEVYDEYVVTNVTSTVVQQHTNKRRSPSPHRSFTSEQFFTPEKHY
jgi:hypothetical protein